MDEITIGDKVYVSSKRAAKITGYAKDYVGQLCREGRVEARLVGRNWYVLESAIREHRFGIEEPVKDPVVGIEERKSVEQTWSKPQYEAETPVSVPELAPKQSVSSHESPAIEDMQSAWREWFSDKRPLEALPDGSEDFKDEYLPIVLPETSPEVPEEKPDEEIETSVNLVKSTDIPEVIEVEQEEAVELHKSYASRDTGETIPSTSVPIVDLSHRKPQITTKKVEKVYSKAGSNIIVKAVLVVIALLFAIVSVIGTGNAERLFAGTNLNFGVQKPIIDFLGGTSTYKSSL